MPVDDNAFLTLRTADGQTAFLHVELHRVEKHVLVRDLRTRRQARDRRPGRQLRCRAPDVVSDAAAKWVRRRRRSGSIRRRINRGRRSSRSLSTTSVLSASRRPDCAMRVPRSPSSRRSIAARDMISPATHVIITRSPLRITLGGGGTDLPSYYREHGGFLIAAAIDKYVFVTVMRPFVPGIFLKYSQSRTRRSADEDHHPIIREAIKLLGFKTPQLEITTLADIPAGTGLGSSGSFTTALLKALYAHRKTPSAPERARRARLRDRDRQAGRADRQTGPVHRRLWRRHLLHVQSGRQRRRRAVEDADGGALRRSRTTCCCSSPASRAAPARSSQTRRQRSESHDADMLDNLHYVKDLGYRSRDALMNGRHDASSAR